MKGRCRDVQRPVAARAGMPIPLSLWRRHPIRFLLRIMLALSIIACASALMLSGSTPLFIAGAFIQGAMYVHLIELQHSILHGHIFASPRLSRAIGFLLGVPMLISYSEFQHKHLQHHRHLGTSLNNETFLYRREQLNTLPGFIKAMLDYSRLKTIVVRISTTFIAGNPSGNEISKRIEQEYRYMTMLLLCACLASALWQGWVLVLWLVPLLFAEPVHFLLELPEHLGLPAHSNLNVFENTRTWGGSWFARWFTHFTNYHIAHHFEQRVPMENLPRLQPFIDSHIPDSSRCQSYPHFFVQVIRGEIKPL